MSLTLYWHRCYRPGYWILFKDQRLKGKKNKTSRVIWIYQSHLSACKKNLHDTIFLRATLSLQWWPSSSKGKSFHHKIALWMSGDKCSHWDVNYMRCLCWSNYSCSLVKPVYTMHSKAEAEYNFSVLDLLYTSVFIHK